MIYNIKAGIIGLQDMGVSYARLIKEHVKNLNLIAACGRSQKEILLAKNDLSLEYVYSDEKSLIENHDIDIILNFANEQNIAHLSIQALEAGKHLFVSNPIALNVEDAIAVHKAAESHPSQRAMALSTVRFSPLLQTLKKTLNDGRIGDILHLELNSAFVKAIAKMHKFTSGSAFLDTALDELDLCLYILDDPIKQVNVESHNGLLICKARTIKGASFALLISPNLRESDSYLKIYGSKGHIIVSNNNFDSFKLFDNESGLAIINIDTVDHFKFSEYLQLHHFTRVMMGKEKPMVKMDHAVDIIKLAVALEKSKVLEQSIDLAN